MLRSRSLLAIGETTHLIFWKYFWNIVARKGNLSEEKVFAAQLTTYWLYTSSLCQRYPLRTLTCRIYKKYYVFWKYYSRAIWIHARLSSPNCSNYFADSPTLSFSIDWSFIPVFMKRQDEFELRPFSSIHRDATGLANEINNSLKTCLWFSQYYCRAFEHLSTISPIFCSWYGVLLYYVWVLCSVFFEIFLQNENTFLTSFGWSTTARETFGWYFFCCHARWCCNRYFPMLHHVDLSTAETQTWFLSLFSSFRALTASEMLCARLC